MEVPITRRVLRRDPSQRQAPMVYKNRDSRIVLFLLMRVEQRARVNGAAK